MGYNSPWHDPYWYHRQIMENEEYEEEYEDEYEEPFEEYQEEVYEVEEIQSQERSIDEICAELDQVICELKRDIKEKEAAIKAEKKRAKLTNGKTSYRKKKTTSPDTTDKPTDSPLESTKEITPNIKHNYNKGKQAINPTLGCIIWIVTIILWAWVIFFM